MLERVRAKPRLMELWWALRPLTSVVRFMQSGAHPDDETSDMLAALAIRDGLNLSYACSTRGEGGQNDIGTEAGAALGALRTREMERACDILNMRMYWHSDSPADTITDFGFSKSGEETLARWGHDRTLARFVEIVRTDRPDILCPTFLDIGGQHGHHRAMTRAAHDVMKAASDPAYPSNLPPWQIKKLYLPAWSGAGRSYDDDAAPPPATVTIDGAGRDAISGWTWAQIGQMSRGFHRTQGMGHWPSSSEARHWPLHLAASTIDVPDDAVASGLPRTLADLAMTNGAGPIADDLCAAQAGIDEALAAFPRFDEVAAALTEAFTALQQARAACPEALAPEMSHRLDAKLTQIAVALRHARGVDARARTWDVFLRPGGSTEISIDVTPGVDAMPDLPPGWRVEAGRLHIDPTATPSDAYRDAYDPADPPKPALTVNLGDADQVMPVRVAFEPEPVVLPACTASVSPDAIVLNTARPAQAIDVQIIYYCWPRSRG